MSPKHEDSLMDTQQADTINKDLRIAVKSIDLASKLDGPLPKDDRGSKSNEPSPKNNEGFHKHKIPIDVI